MSYDVPVIKVKDYSLDDIFKKDLLFLIPFYIFNYSSKKQLQDFEENEKMLEILKTEFESIVERLNELTEQGKLSAYYRMTLLEMSGKVIDSILARYEKTRKEVKDIMGGTILEYEAKTIYLEGENAGYSKGESAGYSKGESVGEITKAKKTAIKLYRMGMMPDQIAEAVETNVSQVREWIGIKPM